MTIRLVFMNTPIPHAHLLYSSNRMFLTMYSTNATNMTIYNSNKWLDSLVNFPPQEGQLISYTFPSHYTNSFVPGEVNGSKLGGYDRAGWYWFFSRLN